MIKSWGIRRRLVMLILAVALPLFAISLASAVLQQRQAIRQASEKLQFSASLVAAGQDRITASTDLLLLAIASAPLVRQGSAAGCQSFFDSLRGAAPIYANIGVLDLSGNVRCQTFQGSLPMGNATDRAYFRDAIATRSFVAGEYAVGRVSKRAVVSFARPVMDDSGMVIAVAFAALDLDALSAELKKLDLPAGVRVSIADRNGTVLASSLDSPEVIGQSIADPTLKDAASRLAAGTATGPDASGAQRLYAFTTGLDPARRWFFASVSMERSFVTAASWRTMFIEVMGLILAVAVGTVAAWRIGARHVLKPAQQLVHAARRVARGNLDARLTLPADDRSEFSDISTAFNRMAESLQMREHQHASDLRQVKSAYELLELVMNSMRDGVLAVNTGGQIVLSNNSAALMLDLAGTAAAPGDWPARYGLYSPGTDRMLQAQEVPLARVLAGQTVRDLDIDIRSGNNRPVRTVRCTFVPMKAEAGIAGAMLVMQDISDLRELQSEQARSLIAMGELQRKLVEAQEIGRLGNWELDLSTDRLWWSDEVHELLGVARGAFDGSTAALMAVMHPDDRQGFMRQRSRATTAGETLDIEYRIVMPDGAIRWIHHIGHSFAATGTTPARRAGVVQDITSRRLADSELLLLRNAVNRLNDMVIITRADPVTGPGPEIVYVNDAFVKASGYASAEVIGKTPRFLQGPRTDRAALDRIRNALERRRSVREELVNYSRDGTAYWVEIDISPLRDERATVTHFIAVQRDITIRKQAEQALLASERRYAALFENAPLPMWVHTEDGSAFLAVNEAAQKQYGYSQEEFSRLSLFDLRPQPERERLARCLALPESERGIDPYWTHQRKDASIFEVEVLTTAVGHMGKPARFAIINDISARVRAEKEVSAVNASLELRVLERTAELEEQRAMFRALAEDSPQIVWMVDKDGGVTYMNRSWYQLTGTSPPDGLGQSWTQHIHPDDIAGMKSNWAASRATGTLYTGQRRIRAQDGRYRTMAYRAAPVVSGGQSSFWVGLDADITDIKATEDALRRSNAELEAFSYTVSHDLRSPLATIDGFAKLLARDMGENQTPKAKHYLDRIGAGASRMGQLIEAMLFMAQLSRSRMHCATVDLSAMASEIVAELRATDAQRDVSVLIENALLVTADSRLMQVILQNLLGNAWKFSSRTQAAAISLTRQPDGSFCVKDNGVGFDMAYAGKLFGTFERLHTEAEFPGTGIGLATVKRAVERHGGRIWAESDPGVSTRFFFTLAEVPALHSTQSPAPGVTANSH